ncbi:MAG: pyruvate kinase [Bacilli bacterium]
MKKTKIICSIGPASCPVEVMTKMVEVGMNVARINFSHATLEERIAVVKSVKEVREITGKNIAILYDTKGPEFRNGMVKNGEITLTDGKTIRVVKENILGDEQRFSVNHPQAIDSLEVGSVILLENGLMKIEVISKEEDGVTCKIISGGILGNKKSLNVPGAHLDIPFISEQDKEDIIYACQHEGDFIALSFVSTKEDVLAAKEILKKFNREDMKIISKIESTTGVDNLDSIIEESDGIMVARGDLGVEVPMEQLPIFQKMIIEKCREYGKTVIVATEMLESMKKNVRPTRAEVSDVANAVLDGTDAVMLSGETTMGKFPVDVVRFMADICENTEKYYDYDYVFENKRKQDTTEAIAESVVSCSESLETKAIVTCTMSGYSANKISNLKPKNIIIATCPTTNVVRSLALSWGVYPVLVTPYKTTDEIIATAKDKACEMLNLKDGDNIIITGGFHLQNNEKTTNFLKIEQI